MVLGATDGVSAAARAMAGAELHACRPVRRSRAALRPGRGAHCAPDSLGACALYWADSGRSVSAADGPVRRRLGVGASRRGRLVGWHGGPACDYPHWAAHRPNSPARNATVRPLIRFLLPEGSAREFHWCFLRGAVWELLLASPPAFQIPQYWALWISAALSLPGIFVHSRHSSERLTTAVILLATTTLFLYTRNFWLCWLLHLGIRGILQWGFPLRQQAA